MPDPFVLDRPVKLGLKLVASVCSDRMDTKGKFFNHIINELDGILLIVTRLNFHGPDPGCVINGRILKASDSAPLKVPERDEVNVYLDMMTRNLFGIPASMNRSAC
jgi:hypothetical protein